MNKNLSSITANHVTSFAEWRQVRIDQNAVTLVIVINGTLSARHKNKVLHIGASRGLFANSLGMSEAAPDSELFEALLIKVQIEEMINIARLVGLSHIEEDETAMPENEMPLPEVKLVDTWIKSVIAYNKENDVTSDASIYYSKIWELLWILSSTNQRASLELFLYPLLTSDQYRFHFLIEQNYKESLSLRQLASLANLSLSTFKRRFQQIYKCSPCRWIQQRRLKDSLDLLGTSQMAISTIAATAGFKNTSFFINRFRIHYGVTPMKYRRSIENRRIRTPLSA